MTNLFGVLWTVAFLLCFGARAIGGEVFPVYMANGIKIGEVTSESAIVWTRLTKRRERNINGKPFLEVVNKEERFAQYDDLDQMLDSALGAAGEVRLMYWEHGQNDKHVLPWVPVDGESDYSKQFSLADLKAGTRYQLKAEGRPKGSEAASAHVLGSFTTAPDASQAEQIHFAVISCTDYPRRDTPEGHKIYPEMSKLGIDFFVHTGDIEYYDRPGPYGNNQELARFKWNRLYALPKQRAFHNVTASYFIKDDHDTLKDDAWPGQAYGDLTWEQGLAIFREQVPMGDKTYRTIRWGRDLQIWLVEGRDFRSPNDQKDGPQKTIWGKEQKEWFFDTVKNSDATFRILVSPTPIVGPDRKNKRDNHANLAFAHEGDEIREFISKQKNMFVICGDRHWQYASEDPKTGVREFGCGSGSDIHAGGYKEEQRTSMHRYLNIKGGFLGVEIKRIEEKAQVVLTHYGVEGTIYNQEVLLSED